MARRLKPEALRAICDPATLSFSSTADLAPLDGMIGQDRAVNATAFGVGMRDQGYNLFALGPARTGKTSVMKRVLARTAESEPAPSDHCYVHNNAAVEQALEANVKRLRALRAEPLRPAS